MTIQDHLSLDGINDDNLSLIVGWVERLNPNHYRRQIMDKRFNDVVLRTDKAKPNTLN